LGITAVIVAFLPSGIPDQALVPIITLCKGFGVAIPPLLERPQFARASLLFVGLVCFVIPAFRDYSIYFPQDFTIDVFFDDIGLDKAVAELNKVSQLSLADNWHTQKIEYFKRLNEQLQEKGITFRFETGRGITVGIGYGSFRAKMTDRWGIQRYRVVEAKGNVKFSTRVLPAGAVQNISTEYELVKTEANDIEPSLKDIYFGRDIVIKPEFYQIITLSQTDRPYNHILTTATRVRIWPAIDIGRTVYLSKEGDKYVPVGYAIYTPKD
jgi:hypothetical protein